MARILVMDDDETIREAVVAALGRAGHDVLAARDGRQGIRILDGFPAELVITDINMPEMDGIEVIVGLRANRPELPIIAMSGGGMLPKELLLENANWLGAIYAMEKPLDLASLLRTVESALGSEG